MGSYGPPVDRLLTLGEDGTSYNVPRHDYASLGIGPADIPELLRLLNDPDTADLTAKDPNAFGPVHALLALGQMADPAALPGLFDFLARQDDEWIGTYESLLLPGVFGAFGRAPFEGVRRILEDEAGHPIVRGTASEILTKIAQTHPETREEAVASFVRVIERPESLDSGLVALVICQLRDLKAHEAGPAIERAYAADAVDEDLISREEVWDDLQLVGLPPPRPEGSKYYDDQFIDDPRYDEPPPSLTPRSTDWSPAEARSPEERKDRNKARKKLERKSKGKKKR